MRTSKLLNLGLLLLALGVALPALAEEVQVADESGTQPAAEAAAPAESGQEQVAPAEPVADAKPAAAVEHEDTAAVAEAAGSGAAEAPEAVAAETEEPATVQPAAEVAPPAAGDPWASETPVETPVAEAPAGEPAPAAAPAPKTAELGAIGYDAEGRPGRIHVVVPGDTLWDISDAYLGTPWVWPSIWQDNREIANPHRIYPGDHIWITPSEMRKVTREQAEALLAGSPAEELMEPASPDLAPVEIPGKAELVPSEQPTVTVNDRELVGLISTEEVDAAASILANIEPRLMISQPDRVYIGLGEGDALEGDQFTIFRVGAKVYDPETGDLLGYHVNYLGWLEVKKVSDESSMAVVQESSADIEIGDKLIARSKPVSEIALKNPPAEVEGQISFLPDARTEMGQLDYVYLNRGTLDGVEVGTPLHVYRKGFRALDTTKDQKLQVPDRVVADLVVVRSQPEASVAFVRHTEEELALGDHFRSSPE